MSKLVKNQKYICCGLQEAGRANCRYCGALVDPVVINLFVLLLCELDGLGASPGPQSSGRSQVRGPDV